MENSKEKNSPEEKKQPFFVRDGSVKEVFGFSPSTARRFAKEGILKRRKVGGVSGYFYDEVVAALTKHAQ